MGSLRHDGQAEPLGVVVLAVEELLEGPGQERVFVSSLLLGIRREDDVAVGDLFDDGGNNSG